MTEKLLLRGAAKTEEITGTAANRPGEGGLLPKRELPGEEYLPDAGAAHLPGLQAGGRESHDPGHAVGVDFGSAAGERVGLL